MLGWSALACRISLDIRQARLSEPHTDAQALNPIFTNP